MFIPQGNFRAVTGLLFGISDMSPLGRKAFVRAAAGVFLVRWPIVAFFSYILMLTGEGIESPSFTFILFMLACFFVIIFMFYMPYLAVLDRRLKFIAVDFSQTFLFIVMLLLCLFEIIIYIYYPGTYVLV